VTVGSDEHVRFYTRFPAPIVHAEAAFRHILNDNSSKTTTIALLVRDDIEPPLDMSNVCKRLVTSLAGPPSTGSVRSFVSYSATLICNGRALPGDASNVFTTH
jgi:hypothetical protein